ncbi:MAG: hypothetical protein ACK4Z8_15310 [Novosphingobium sp.]
MGVGAWLFAGGVLAVWLGGGYLVGKRNYRRAVQTLRARRADPSREAFTASLSPEVRAATAEWFWQQLQAYYQPDLSPHPDDDLIRDMPIDPEEPEDWVRDYCRANGLKERNLEPWPEGMAVTPRNLLGWLENERRRLSR